MIRLSGEQANTLRQALGDVHDSYKAWAADLIKQIDEQREAPGWGEELLDVVAAAIGRSTAKVAFTGQALSALRTAILRPSELAKAKLLLDEQQSCVGCGIAINNNEMVTMYKQQVYCVKCVFPQYTTCPGCKDVRGLDGVVKKAMQKADKACLNCAAVARNQPAESAGRIDESITNRPATVDWESVAAADRQWNIPAAPRPAAITQAQAARIFEQELGRRRPTVLSTSYDVETPFTPTAPIDEPLNRLAATIDTLRYEDILEQERLNSMEEE